MYFCGLAFNERVNNHVNGLQFGPEIGKFGRQNGIDLHKFRLDFLSPLLQKRLKMDHGPFPAKPRSVNSMGL